MRTSATNVQVGLEVKSTSKGTDEWNMLHQSQQGPIDLKNVKG